MYKNLTRFMACDSPAARWSLARVIIRIHVTKMYYFHFRYLQCKLRGAISVRDKVSLSWWHKSKATRLLQSSAQLPAFTLLHTQSEDFHEKQPN